MIQKYSYHPPNICRSALTKEYTKSVGTTDRNSTQWLRDETPPLGSRKVVRVMRIATPTDYLSTRIKAKAPHSQCYWIDPAPCGGTTFVDVFFTRDDETVIRELLASEVESLQHDLIAYRQLENGEAFAITSFHVSISHEPVRLKAAFHDQTDIIALPVDPGSTGRPLRLALNVPTNDGDFLPVWELGCYRSPPLTDAEWEQLSYPYRSRPAGSITRNSPPILGSR